jgi:hypothetical protein
MQGATIAGPLPATAWEQAVFVALFVVFVMALLGWFTNQQKQWQQFIQVRDDQWQKFLREQRANDEQKSEAMTESLNALTAATQALVTEVQGQRADFQAHDQREWAKLDEMSVRIHEPERFLEPKTQPRRKN